MEDTDRPLGFTIGRTLAEYFRSLKGRINEISDMRLTPEQLGMLYVLSREDEEVIQQKMAEKLGKDKSAVLRTIDNLESKELVRRIPSKSDRRMNQLFIRKKGESIVQRFLAAEFRFSKEILEGLSEEQINNFFIVLSHIRKKSENI
jgi:MarR family transcriptional regulator for hemolysin